MEAKRTNFKAVKHVGMRLDKAIVDLLGNISRSYVQKLIDEGFVFVNNLPAKASYHLDGRDWITIVERGNEPSAIAPEYIPLDIVYEDDDVIVVNKPRGLVVHPGAGNKDLTLANALMFHTDHLSAINGKYRPGIVHRIDKDTSGLLAVAKNDNAHRALSEQLKNHTMHRKYLALVKGVIVEDDGKIIAPLARDKKNRLKMAVDTHDGKEAITHFHVLKRYKDATLVECRLETGRTHQIRVHFEYIKHPVLGDPLYGKDNRGVYNGGQLLHAAELTFVHPTTKESLTFSCPPPHYFQDIADSLQ